MTQFIVIVGNVVDGLSFYGPFDDNESAFEYADGLNFDSEWTITQLRHPADGDE